MLPPTPSSSHQTSGQGLSFSAPLHLLHSVEPPLFCSQVLNLGLYHQLRKSLTSLCSLSLLQVLSYGHLGKLSEMQFRLCLSRAQSFSVTLLYLLDEVWHQDGHLILAYLFSYSPHTQVCLLFYVLIGAQNFPRHTAI